MLLEYHHLHGGPRALNFIMRIYSYLFHGLLALFLLAISAIALLSGTSLHLDVLPWSGTKLVYILFFSALFGLLTVLLAMKGTVRFLFFLWSLAVCGAIVRGFFLGSYRFADQAMMKNALYLTAGSLLAIVGAWLQMRRQRNDRRSAVGR
jgi:FtsH-binding integral membrane protein